MREIIAGTKVGRWFIHRSERTQRNTIVTLLLLGYVIPWLILFFVVGNQVDDVRNDTTISTNASTCNNRYVIRVLVDAVQPNIPPDTDLAQNFRRIRNSLDVSKCGPPSKPIRDIYLQLGVTP